MEEKIILFIFFCVFSIMGFAVYYDMNTTAAHEIYQAECEAKGGVYLDRTYSAGKYTGHKYTCVKKEVIIE